MKQTRTIFLFLATLFCVSGCVSDDEQPLEEVTNIEITFTGTYGTEVLQMQKEYDYGDGRGIKFSEFNFYVSDLVLLENSSPDSPETALKSIDFIDLAISDATAAAEGQTITIQGVPTGDYAGIKLGLGVSADLNRTQPEDYGSNSPLSKSSHYWGPWNSYIFCMIESFADLNNDGTIVQGGADSEGVSYHLGADEVYVTVTRHQNISLVKDVKGKIKLNVDLGNAYQMTDPTYDVNQDGLLDIETFSGTHSDSLQEISKKIMSNLGNSITLEL